MPSPQKLIFVINYAARNGEEMGRVIEKYMKRKHLPYQIILSEAIGHAEWLVDALKNNSEEQRFIIVGGDGTLNHFVTLLEDYQVDTPIGYLATGSGNDFARAMGLPRSFTHQLQRMIHLESPKEVDILCAEDQQSQERIYAVNSLGFGIDGWVNYLINQQPHWVKGVAGNFSYLLNVIKAYTNQAPFSVKITDENGTHTFEQVRLVVFANNRYFGGGIDIVPHANNTDEQLDVVIADDADMPHYLNMLKKLLTTKTHLSDSIMHTLSSHRFTAEISAGQYGQADGEVLDDKARTLVISTKKRRFWI
ncbi:MAG: diacylglycerol kinase family protein [Aerococcus sp.]|nr:diacylglycerol kinase family protein [Aerococcus sp.]